MELLRRRDLIDDVVVAGVIGVAVTVEQQPREPTLEPPGEGEEGLLLLGAATPIEQIERLA